MYNFLISFLIFSAMTSSVIAQSDTIAAPENDTLPVEATADDLQVNTEENSAVFAGNARVVQGVLDLRADKITVVFEEVERNIKLVNASGQVTFTNGAETAKAQNAQFDVLSQIITFSGNVVLHQTQTILTGNKLTYNIKTSRSNMTGNVKTVFVPK